LSEAGRQLPDFPGGPVLQPGPANGSPIGFRSLLVMSVTPDDSRRAFAQTGLYPIYDPNDVFNKPQIAEYHPILFAGRAFVTAQAEDADGFRDNRIQSCCGDGRGLVISIENGSTFRMPNSASSSTIRAIIQPIVTAGRVICISD